MRTKLRDWKRDVVTSPVWMRATLKVCAVLLALEVGLWIATGQW